MVTEPNVVLCTPLAWNLYAAANNTIVLGNKFCQASGVHCGGNVYIAKSIENAALYNSGGSNSSWTHAWSITTSYVLVQCGVSWRLPPRQWCCGGVVGEKIVAY